MVDARLVMNLLTREANIETAVYQIGADEGVYVTDREIFSLAMSEFGFSR